MQLGQLLIMLLKKVHNLLRPLLHLCGRAEVQEIYLLFALLLVQAAPLPLVEFHRHLPLIVTVALLLPQPARQRRLLIINRLHYLLLSFREVVSLLI